MLYILSFLNINIIYYINFFEYIFILEHHGQLRRSERLVEGTASKVVGGWRYRVFHT